MKLDIYVADPAGNVTIFVKTPVEREDYVAIANKLLELKEYGAEQVAYIKSFKNKPYQMEMMGLEFCGNATRSFAYLVARENHLKTPQNIEVDVSGSDEPLEVKVDFAKEDATVAMAEPKSIDVINIEGNVIPVVDMGGISHVILENHSFNEELADKILDHFILAGGIDALGLMFVKNDEMYPVVYVHNTKTFIHEGSCGSGSIAYAYYKLHKKDKGQHKLDIKQPGGALSVTIDIGNTVQCFLSGKLTISELLSVEI